jgi:predicted enzyme related to lactoylglutathione lyase
MMNTTGRTPFGKFIWHDLAAADTAAASDFYRTVFGWTAMTESANGGQFIRLQCDGQDVGSMYRMSQREREHGVPSHWTPYVCVRDIDATAGRVEAAGGAVLVQPFEVDGVARIALITDSIGSIMGLWESLRHE